jgi:hypothetical protein
MAFIATSISCTPVGKLGLPLGSTCFRATAKLHKLVFKEREVPKGLKPETT